jgi:hypothetical protein
MKDISDATRHDRHDRSGTEEYGSGHRADSASPGNFDVVSRTCSVSLAVGHPDAAFVPRSKPGSHD